MSARRSVPPVMLATVATAAACALTACGGGSSAPQRYQGVVFTTAYAKPAVTLTSSDDGRPFDFRARTAGETTLVYFGYTHCPDVCPTVMADTASALRHIPAAVAAKTKVLFVTTDPARDTPAVLKAYLAKFDAGFTGLSGPQPTIAAMGDALGDEVDAPTDTTGDYQVGHGTQVFGFGPDGTAKVAWVPGDANQLLLQMEHDLPMLAAGVAP